MAILLLKKLKEKERITVVFSNNIVLLILKIYTQWIQESLYYEKYEDAVNIYNTAISQYPDEQEVKLS